MLDRLLAVTADLMSEDSENPEYDRACVEIVCTMLGLSTDARGEVSALLRRARRGHPEGTTRDQMGPLDALQECYDLWASGAWDDSNAVTDLEEVMDHLGRLFR